MWRLLKGVSSPVDREQTELKNKTSNLIFRKQKVESTAQKVSYAEVSDLKGKRRRPVMGIAGMRLKT